MLESIARDPATDAIHRDRALAALAYWDDDGVQALFVNLLNAPDTSEMNRHRLIGFLARTFGDRALPYIEGYLASSDLQFRLTAVDAISVIHSPAAIDRLKQAMTIETDSFVQQRLHIALDAPVTLPH